MWYKGTIVHILDGDRASYYFHSKLGFVYTETGKFSVHYYDTDLTEDEILADLEGLADELA
jgi:hypothetical protein